ncbi:unnamed protein product, partial [Prorocentrum cordatum]
DQAKHLGLILGRGAEDASWTAPLAKMLDRAQLWGAFRVVVASVVTFVAQLRPLGMASAEFLTQLRDLGFPCELMDIRCAAIAAKARVCHYEDAQQGGLRVRSRARQFRHRMQCALRELLLAHIELRLESTESTALFVLGAAEERAHELERVQNLPCARTAKQE